MIGSLFTWGVGWLFYSQDLNQLLIPMADLIITFPVSIIAAIGIYKQKKWGIYFGLLASGIYIFVSVLVFIKLFYLGSPYPLKLIVPALFGFIYAFIYIMNIFNSYKRN